MLVRLENGRQDRQRASEASRLQQVQGQTGFEVLHQIVRRCDQRNTLDKTTVCAALISNISDRDRRHRSASSEQWSGTPKKKLPRGYMSELDLETKETQFGKGGNGTHRGGGDSFWLKDGGRKRGTGQEERGNSDSRVVLEPCREGTHGSEVLEALERSG